MVDVLQALGTRRVLIQNKPAVSCHTEAGSQIGLIDRRSQPATRSAPLGTSSGMHTASMLMTGRKSVFCAPGLLLPSKLRQWAEVFCATETPMDVCLSYKPGKRNHKKSYSSAGHAIMGLCCRAALHKRLTTALCHHGDTN